MLANRKVCIISAKKKEKANGQTKNKNNENQKAIIACYAARKIFNTQRRFNNVNTKNKNFTVDNVWEPSATGPAPRSNKI